MFAFGLGLGSKNRRGEWLQVYYSNPVFKPTEAQAKKILSALDTSMPETNFAKELSLNERKALRVLDPELSWVEEAKGGVVATCLWNDAPPQNVPEAYLKLHLLSHRLVRPNSIDLSGIFKVLPNVAWTNHGPIDLEELEEERKKHLLKGSFFSVDMVDKFPKMTDYIVPRGVRIADPKRVRLGAYLGEGTTVMQEGFINFNAGCEGPAMVEGRISAGVWVGAQSDIGGGASTMGTLSGGNNIKISIGKRCLLGANSGLGIPLGDGCTIEAGLYLTSASKVRLLDPEGKVSKVVKAHELSGQNALLFRRNSLDGAIECLPNKTEISLNPDLHSQKAKISSL